MQLEAGKKYTDRRGRVYGPIIKTGSLFWGEHAETPLWNNDGTIDRISRDMDLVAEYVEPVKADSKPADNRVNPGDGYRLLNVGEVEQADDEWYSRNDDEWRKTVCAGMKVTDFDVSQGYSIRRKAEPAPVESPDDWVIQDRVPAREGIDFGWNVSAKDFDVYVPDDRWKWSISGSYTGRMHGSYGNMSRLAVFCRRKDLPPEKPVVDPGEGYRLLADDEITLSTDERAYVWGPDDRSEWDTLKEANSREFVGVTVASLLVDRPNMAVRRKLPPATRTIVLKEWICWDDDCPDAAYVEWSSVCPTRETLKYFGADHAHPTGNTRTAEIPVT